VADGALVAARPAADRPPAEPARLLAAARAFRPVPDGAGLVFASDLPGLATPFRLPAPDRFPRKLLASQDRTLPVCRTPAGLVLRRDHLGNEIWELVLLEPDGSLRRLAGDGRTVHRDVTPAPDGARVGLVHNPSGSDWEAGTLDIASGQVHRWAGGRGHWSWLGWSPDGGRAVVARNRHTLLNEAFLVGPAGESTPLLPDCRQVAAVAWLPDRLLAVTDAGTDRLTLVAVDPKHPERPGRPLFDAAGEVLALAAHPDGRQVAVVVQEGAYDRVLTLDLATGRQQVLDGLPPGVVYSDGATEPPDNLGYGPDGRLFVAWETATSPGEIYQLPGATRWTGAGGDLPGGLVEPREVVVPSFDGTAVPALHYRVDGRPRPTVVWFHGGPEGQSRAGYNPAIAMWNAAGFDVLAPNVRGSTGYGYRYASLDDRELRWDSVRDGCAVGRWLRERGHATRLIAMGRSYGGFLALAVSIEQPALWDAVVDVVGITDWHTFFRGTSGWRRSLRIVEYGDPDGAEADYLAEISPLRRAAEISAHLLVVHGRHDARVPVGEAIQIHQAVPGSELLLFEDEGHGISKQANAVRAYERALSFVRERLDLD
jgi:dipeptidyl aminopeptidase/acylaminoacyl peptidase